MKAYRVTGYDVNSNEEKTTIVFAEKTSKAKTLASKEPDFHYISYLNLRARREPLMDKYYQEGKRYLNWNIQKDRVILVEELGWYCNFDFDVYECKDCLAKEHCSKYWEQQEEWRRFGVFDDE